MIKMKFRKLFTVFILLVLIFPMGCGKTDETNNIINSVEVESLIIIALPSPPKVKIIDKEDDIKEIISFINSIELSNMKQEDINGWEFRVITEGEDNHSISFVGNKIKIDSIWYKINGENLTELRNIYNNLDYEEIPISDYFKNDITK